MDLQSVLDPSDFNLGTYSDLYPTESNAQAGKQGQYNKVKISLDENVSAAKTDFIREAYIQQTGQQVPFSTTATGTPKSTHAVPVPVPCPASQRNNSHRDHLPERDTFLEGDYLGNMGAYRSPEINLEPLQQADERRRFLFTSSRYPYPGCTSERSALQRALLASEAGESPNYIRALLMSDARIGDSFGYGDPGVRDSSMSGNNSMYNTFPADEWEEGARRVGKCQSMRDFSTFNEESELLRQTLSAMRRCQAQHSPNKQGNLFDDRFEPRIRSTAEAYQMPSYANCHNGYYNGASFGRDLDNLDETFGMYGYSGQQRQGIFNTQEHEMANGEKRMHIANSAMATNQAPLNPFYNRGSQFVRDPSFPFMCYGANALYAGHNATAYGKMGAEEQYFHSKGIVRPVESQSMRYNGISFLDDLKKESTESCAKIDGTRSQSMRDMAQCWACGQRMWVAQGDEVSSKLFYAREQQQQPQEQQGYHPEAATSIHPSLRSKSAIVAAKHKARASAAGALLSSSSSSSSSAQPPRSPVTISMGCNPSANKKKKVRIIRLCRQFLGLSGKT